MDTTYLTLRGWAFSRPNYMDQTIMFNQIPPSGRRDFIYVVDANRQSYQDYPSHAQNLKPARRSYLLKLRYQVRCYCIQIFYRNL